MTGSSQNLQMLIPQTRLQAPQIGVDILKRPLLQAHLQQAISRHPFTLISAPAGSGKTTLVAAWLRDNKPAMPVAWLRLAKDDNELSGFFTAVLAALRQLDAQFGSDWQTVLLSTPDLDGSAQRLVAVLVNQILASSLRPFTLVLDDLHLIENNIVLNALDTLLENLPPDMHIVATSRYDPPLSLARLRLQGRLAEIRLDALRFNHTETQTWLNDILQLNLSPTDLARLQTHTEGWAAGLRLLALSLNQLDSEAGRAYFLQHLSQSGRHLFDFLAEEILNHQPPELRRFLLVTAVLDELTPEWCTAVAQQPNAPQLLDEIYHRNLFLTWVESETGGWVYRYHDLFSEFLRQRLTRELSPDQIQTLHRFAAQSVTQPEQAIHHYLSAELWDEAASLIKSVGRAELSQGFVRTQLGQWIQKLPKTVAAQPQIAHILGGLAYQSGRIEEAQGYLETAVAGLKSEQAESELAQALYRLAGTKLELEGPQASINLLTAALSHPLPTGMKVAAHIDLAWSLVPQYDWPQVSKHVASAIEQTLASGAEGAFRSLAQHMGITIYFSDLGLAPIRQFCQQALARFGEGEGIIQMGAYLHLGLLAALDGRLNEAMQFSTQSAQISQRLGGFAYVDQNIGFAQGVVGLAYGNRQALTFALDEALHRADERGQYRAALAALSYYNGRSAWLDGDGQRIQDMRVLLNSIDHRLQSLEAEAAHSLLEAYQADLDGRFTAAEKAARRAIQLQNRFRHPVNTGCAQLVLAELYLKWKRPSQSLALLQSALAKWEKLTMPGVPLMQGPSLIPALELAVKHGVKADFAHKILDLFPSYNAPLRPVPVPETGASLTPREVEVLRLIVDGAANRAIADQLVISERTVKSHVTSILRKLDVKSRALAAAKARELQLL
ncbi:MAG: AAA family ATPase [Ardenticatenaceae bacterium]|nr:AAA family ATPase [Ardenticatenaceae bacterium]